MIETLKKQVLKILEEYPKSRDSDQWLTIKLWTVYYPSRIHRRDDLEPSYVYLKDIMDLPREDNVSRARRIIQNVENKFLPTSIEVVRQREINEERWLEYIRNEKNYDTKI